ncbi:tRNA pseudouridine(13) synthase TruD [Candidatus Pyrohabitans sp.]
MLSRYELDRILGMEYFISDTPGISGKLRVKVEDFIVEEHFEPCDDGEGEYVHFILEKYNWDTIRAITQISRRLRVSLKRFGYAGTKDKRALTRQRVSVWRVSEEELANLEIPGLRLYSFTRCRERINLGNLLGNEFTVTIRRLNGEDLEDILAETTAQLSLRGVPNYFGYQRFGTVRPNTHLVGRAIVQGDLEEAVMLYLARPYPKERSDAFTARKLLDETRDYRRALELFPARLHYERNMLDSLSKNPRDFAGALRRLPKKLRRMLVHAYQSYLFNRILSRLIAEGADIRDREIPLFGYESRFSPGRQGEIEQEVLEEENLELESFRIKSLPELAMPGSARKAAVNTRVSYTLAGDELHEGMKKLVVSFFLPPGSYATTVLREYMKAEPLDY